MNVTTIIPAYNEGTHIGEVLSTICAVEIVDEIIVVSDGSTDDTVDVAKSFNVDVIELDKNYGKGFAMRTGVNYARFPIILFLDADLKGIQPCHIDSLLVPLCLDMADMTLGVFDSGRGVTDLAQRLTPFLTGQRGIKRFLLDEIEEEEWSKGFGIELMLTKYARARQLRTLEIPLNHVSHVMKEEKMGLARGVASRFKMYWEIAKELNKP